MSQNSKSGEPKAPGAGCTVRETKCWKSVLLQYDGASKIGPSAASEPAFWIMNSRSSRSGSRSCRLSTSQLNQQFLVTDRHLLQDAPTFL